MSYSSSLKRNGIYNFLGSALPVFVSLVTVPLYLSHVGAAGYGILTIVWMLQGYFGFFDLGLSRATANQVARLGEQSEPAERESVVFTALMLNVLLGLVGGVVLYFFGSLIIGHFVSASGEMREHVLVVMPWIAASVPITTVSSVLVGSLEGREKFGVLNAVQLGNMFIFQTIPLIASYVISPDVSILIPAAIVGGLISVVFLSAAVLFSFPIRFVGRPSKANVKLLFGYGAWVSVSNFIVPIMEAADRFIISSFLGPVAVAHYNVPYNLAIRVRILPTVLARTIFPRMSAQSSENSSVFFDQAIRLLTVILTPLVVLGIFVMMPFISLWIDPAFATTAAPIGCILLVGIWFNSLSTIPGTYLQARARPGVVARIQMYQIVPFLAVLWWAIQHFGLMGAAWVWTIRVMIDAVLQFLAASPTPALRRFMLAPLLLLGTAYLVDRFFVSTILQSFLFAIPLVALSIVWVLRAEPRFPPALRGILRGLGQRISKTPDMGAREESH